VNHSPSRLLREIASGLAHLRRTLELLESKGKPISVRVMLLKDRTNEGNARRVS
jgi:hypothetical protein